MFLLKTAKRFGEETALSFLLKTARRFGEDIALSFLLEHVAKDDVEAIPSFFSATTKPSNQAPSSFSDSSSTGELELFLCFRNLVSNSSSTAEVELFVCFRLIPIDSAGGDDSF